MITLHHGGRAGHSASVLIALAEKGLDYESRPIDLFAHEQHGGAFLAINRAGQVPVLEEDGKCLTETFFILQYLDERYPDPPLMPADPKARYNAYKWGKYVETHIAPNLAIFGWAARGAKLDTSAQAGLARLTPERRLLWQQARDGFDDTLVETARAAIEKAIGRVAEELVQGPWLAGETYSIADIAAYPHVARARTLGFAVPEAGTAWLDRVGSRPRVLEALGRPDAGPDIITMGPERGRWG
jgi:glutathione S-transferase